MNRTEAWSSRPIGPEVHDHLFVPLIHQNELPARFGEQAFVRTTDNSVAGPVQLREILRREWHERALSHVDEESSAIAALQRPVGDRTYIDDPIIVIEVMSPGSKPRDERLKHSLYSNMPTIRHIVLIDAERIAVQHDVRTEGGYDRSILTDSEAVIDLTAVGFSIALEKVYSGIVAG